MAAAANDLNDYVKQPKSVQRAVFDGLQTELSALPSESEAIKALRDGRINLAGYEQISNTRTSLGNTLYNLGPTLIASGVLTKEEIDRVRIANTAVLAGIISGGALNALGKGPVAKGTIVKSAEEVAGTSASPGAGNALATDVQAVRAKNSAEQAAAKTLRTYGPQDAGPLGNPNDLRAPASTFRSGSYAEKVAETDLYFYHDYGGRAKADGRYWTPQPSTGPLQSQLDSAILPEFGNTLQNQAIIKVPKGTVYYEGAAAPQAGTVGTRPSLQGGGVQIFLPNPKTEWIIKR